jgi:hypothetical protein
MTESQHHPQRASGSEPLSPTAGAETGSHRQLGASGSEPLSARAGDEEFVEFVRAGDRTVGELECVACGCRAVVRGDIEPCAECGGELWERSSWSPFSNVLAALRARVD